MVHDMMDTLTTLWLGLYEQVAAQIHIHHIHIWEDMSGKQGSLISPALMEEFMMPCYDRIAAFAVRHGVEIVSVDSDGKVDEVVAVVARHGVNAFMPFEVQAGSDAEEFGRNYPKLGLMGGLDKRAVGFRDLTTLFRRTSRGRITGTLSSI
jgi:uroporphyrinogen decarboxylase